MPFVLIIGIGVVLTAFVAYAQAILAHSVNKGLVGWLAQTVQDVALFGPRLAAHLLKLDGWITHQLGAHFKQIEHRAVGWVSGISTYAKVMALAGMNVAAISWSLAWWLVHTEIPRQSKAHAAHAESVATHADALAEIALKRSSGLAKSHPGKVTQVEVTRIERVAMPHASEWEWINHHWNALTRAVTAPTTLPGIIAAPKVGDIVGWTRRNLRWHHRRLARLEALLGVTGMAAVLARVLGVSVRCLRPGGNVSKVARGLCGLPTHLLNDLLGVLADIWILENVCVLLPYLETAAKDIGTPLVAALTDVGAGICGDSKRPGALRGSSASLPPVLVGASGLV